MNKGESTATNNPIVYDHIMGVTIYTLSHSNMMTLHIQMEAFSALAQPPESVTQAGSCLSSRCSAYRWLFLGVIWGPGAWLESGWLCSLCTFSFNGRVLGAFYMCWLMSCSVKRAENYHCGGIVDFSLREHYTSPGSW